MIRSNESLKHIECFKKPSELTQENQGVQNPSSPHVKDIVENDLENLILQSDTGCSFLSLFEGFGVLSAKSENIMLGPSVLMILHEGS